MSYLNDEVAESLNSALADKDIEINRDSLEPLSGGSINEAYSFNSGPGKWFIKVNHAARYPKMFEREFEGLNQLAATKAILVPEPILHGESQDVAYLVTEFIESGPITPSFWQGFAQDLARLHQNHGDQFGLDHHNYIGSLEQYNTFHDTWIEFFVTERLEKLVAHSRDTGLLNDAHGRQFDKLYHRLEHYLPIEPPSLIHGDLWNGNYLCSANGKAAIFDPAIYYGHREMDIAMSRLFGGFDEAFYKAYDEFHPMEQGWNERIDLHNLYPLLVHLVLFGAGYRNDVLSRLKRFT